MYSKGRVIVEGKDVTEIVTCVACKELPIAAIHQCKNGHALCPQCDRQLRVRTCPECRVGLPDISNPIRNLRLEQLLNEVVKVECPFEDCGKRMSRNFAENHISGCLYNFQKFGNFVNLCEKLGYSSCKFRVNNGNTAVAIQHFISEHGFYLSESPKFEMLLRNFHEALDWETTTRFWTPVIMKLPGNHGHLLLAPLLYKAEDFTYLTVSLPDSGSYNPAEPQIALRVKYKIPEVVLAKPGKISFTQDPKSIREIAETSLEALPRSFLGYYLKDHIDPVMAFRIVCVVEGYDAISNIQIFRCIMSPSLPNKFSVRKIVTKVLEDVSNLAKVDREKIWTFLFELFEDKTNPKGFTAVEMNYLKMESVGLVLRMGTTSQLAFLTKKICTIKSIVFDGDGGFTTLHYVLREEQDKKIGLEKVKFLVTSGEDFQSLNNLKQSVLHFAALYGTEDIVKCILDKLKLDVNAQDAEGQTPLYLATKNTDRDCAIKITTLLLNEGADPGIKTKNGQCPLDCASGSPKPREKRKKIPRSESSTKSE